MKILIIIPSRSYNGQPGYLDFPAEMLSVAANLESHGHEIKFSDCNVEALTIDSVRQFQPNMAVFYVSTGPEISDALNKSQEYKTIGIKVAWCGCHPTASPEQTLSAGFIDYAVIGGAEVTLVELASSLNTGKPGLSAIPGLGFKEVSGKIRLNDTKPPAQDVDDLPDPAWHLVDFKRYPDTNLNTCRGGRYACTFFPGTGDCNAPPGGELSPERIVAQMKQLRREFGARHVYFSGCSLAADSRRFKDFCREAIKDNLKTAWTLPVASTLDEGTVRLMKKAGCASVLLEIGSGSERLRQFLEKGDLREVEKTFWMLVKHKVIPTVFVNYGYPSETTEDFKETINLLSRLDQPPVLFMKFVPYPGTKLFDYCTTQGLITARDTIGAWADYTDSCLKVNLSQVPQEQLDSELTELRRTYASRRVRFMARHNPGYVFSMVRRPREFFKRIKDLAKYYFETTRS